ncbi:PKD domain-containing protein [Flavobacterium cellulosilyticum]|uniref:PKD domain-containing protein n=1 Tax=Flavobacterium cellulosilyticum TaxID=2541731 RepID=A0A4R5CDC9_9FLAO|nr:PKD domain-containing protein [Flavobacterium cellulosilyticum]TDD97495.1 PKD domain-containing protein [Flavobacterium cellulosilyticum]
MKSLFKLIFIFIVIHFSCVLNAKDICSANILALPSATISGTTAVCQNASQPLITFTGSGGTAPYTFTYTINGGADLIVKTTGSNNSVTVLVNTTNTGTFNYNLISVHDSANPNPEQPSLDIATVTVNAPTNVDFTFTNNTTCSGTVIQFAATASGTASYTYAWDFGDGTTSAQQNPSHSFVSLGCGTANFNVTLTVKGGGCTISKTKIITVIQKPDISFSDINNPFDPFNNCANASSNAVYSVKVGNSSASTCVSSYSINWGDGNTQNSITFPITHNYATIGAYSMIITAVGNNGCINSKTYIIKNVSNPLGGLNSPGSTQNLCAPTTNLQFSISNWGSNSIDTTYKINYSDGSPTVILTQNQLNSSTYYNLSDPSNSTNYPIPHVYSTSSCPSPSFEVKLDVTNACGTTPFTLGNISILTKPTANFTSPPNACINSNVLFTNTTVSGYGQNCVQGSIYTWDFGDGSPLITTPISSPQNINHTYTTSGTFTITLTSQNGCGTSSKTRQICIESPLVPTFTLNNTTGCSPQAITSTNTTSETNSCIPPTYIWSTTFVPSSCGSSITAIPNQTATNASYNFTEPGTYTIKLTATNSCGSFSTSQTVIVKKPPTVTINALSNFCGPTTINPTAIVNSCAPATSTLTYAWSFPGGTPSSSTSAVPGAISYSAAGNYTVSLSVTNECGTTMATNQSFTINSTPTITGNLSSCVGFSSQLTGSITAATAFPWISSNPSIATVSATGLVSGVSGGTTTITYTNSNNCKTTALFTVNAAPTITQPTSSTVCQGANPIPLSITISGATGSPTYQWYSNVANDTTTGTAIPNETNTTYTPSYATVGTTYYYCIITLPSGDCSSIKSNTATITINSGATINSQPTATQSLCVGATILSPLSIMFSGGTGSVSYQWYSNTSLSNVGGTAITGATNSGYTPPANIVSGNYNYYVSVSFSGNGCGPISSDPAEIIVVSDPIVDTQPLSTQTLCQSATPTNLTVSTSGGIGTFTYQWYSNSVNSNTGGTSVFVATNNSFTPPTSVVGKTYYYCLISQTGRGCSVLSATAEVIINLAPKIVTQPQSSTVCLGTTPTLLTVSYSNGAGTPSHQWYSNNVNSTTGGTSISGASTASYAPPKTAIGTEYYYCIITLPVGGCSILTSNIAAVTINPIPVISNKNTTICSGNSFTITPDNSNGDTVPAGPSYTWTNPTISPSNSILGASAQSVPQSSIGQTLINTTTNPATVTYKVTPLSGVCSGTIFTVVVTVNPSISTNVISNNSSCFGANNGSIKTNVTGGIPFNSGPPYIISWTGPNGFTASTSGISNLIPGNYNLTITDAGGCPFDKSYTISEPNEIIIFTDEKKDITCYNSANGKIKISISGGTLNYTFAWTKNGIPYASTEDVSNLSPGVYSVKVSDVNNCGPATASFTIAEPPILVVNLASKTDVICYGQPTGAITLNSSGGTLPYTYAWTGPNGFTSTNQNLTNLFAGSYTLIVTDNLGCFKSLNITLTQSTAISIKATTTPITCYGDNNASINIAISGGVAPYQISWSNFAIGTFQNNLSAGDYLVTVTDNLNCVQTLNINIPEAPIFTVNPVVKNISCFGANNGSIDLNFIGGIAPIKLNWSDGSTAGTTRNNLKPGSYTVTIIDSKPCTITRTFIILEPQLLVLSANLTHALDCDNANSGAINLLVSGGSAPFTYVWSNGATTEDLNNIPAGNYLVTVKDANGCSKQAQYSINRPPPIVTNVVTKTDFDCETKYVHQTFVAQVSGGVPPYQLVWSSGTFSGPNNEFMNTSQNGTAILSATDAMGCKSTVAFNVKLQNLGTPSFDSSSFAYSTFGTYSINDPIQFTNTSTGDYISMIWDFGDGTTSTELNPVHTFINPKEYVVTQTVSYPFGCIYVQKITFSIGKGYVLVVPNAFTPNNDALNDTFRPVTKALKNVRLDVYDTWGSIIYSETGDVLRGWDGKIKGFNAENGNYYCKVSGATFYGTIVNENHPFVLLK